VVIACVFSGCSLAGAPHLRFRRAEHASPRATGFVLGWERDARLRSLAAALAIGEEAPGARAGDSTLTCSHQACGRWSSPRFAVSRWRRCSRLLASGKRGRAAARRLQARCRLTHSWRSTTRTSSVCMTTPLGLEPPAGEGYQAQLDRLESRLECGLRAPGYTGPVRAAARPNRGAGGRRALLTNAMRRPLPLVPGRAAALAARGRSGRGEARGAVARPLTPIASYGSSHSDTPSVPRRCLPFAAEACGPLYGRRR